MARVSLTLLWRNWLLGSSTSGRSYLGARLHADSARLTPVRIKAFFIIINISCSGCRLLFVVASKQPAPWFLIFLRYIHVFLVGNQIQFALHGVGFALEDFAHD